MNVCERSETFSADGVRESQHLHYRFYPQCTQINKGVAPAFEISQTRSVTQFLKFSEAGRQATSWGHVPHHSLCSSFWGWGWSWSRALQTNSEEVGERVCISLRHYMNPWPGPKTPACKITLIHAILSAYLLLHTGV